MPKELTLQEAHQKCSSEGNIIFLLENEPEKSASLLAIADEEYQGAQNLRGQKLWNSTYKLHYDVLHQLVEAFLLFERVKSKNHHCLFSYLCIKAS